MSTSQKPEFGSVDALPNISYTTQELKRARVIHTLRAGIDGAAIPYFASLTAYIFENAPEHARVPFAILAGLCTVMSGLATALESNISLSAHKEIRSRRMS